MQDTIKKGLEKFTYHIVYIKLGVLASEGGVRLSFTYHIVYIKPNAPDIEYPQFMIFTYHIVYIKPQLYI